MTGALFYVPNEVGKPRRLGRKIIIYSRDTITNLYIYVIQNKNI